MKITTLLENGACGAELGSAHGLSLYIETPKHRILFDMGPDEQFLSNAEKLGVDLKAVDLAILSHGHYDHGGGLETFCKLNDTAKIYLRQGAFGDYVALEEDGDLRKIGLDVPECAKLANLLREKGFDMPEGIYSMEDVSKAILDQLKTGGDK